MKVRCDEVARRRPVPDPGLPRRRASARYGDGPRETVHRPQGVRSARVSKRSDSRVPLSIIRPRSRSSAAVTLSPCRGYALPRMPPQAGRPPEVHPEARGRLEVGRPGSPLLTTATVVRRRRCRVNDRPPVRRCGSRYHMVCHPRGDPAGLLRQDGFWSRSSTCPDHGAENTPGRGPGGEVNRPAARVVKPQRGDEIVFDGVDSFVPADDCTAVGRSHLRTLHGTGTHGGSRGPAGPDTIFVGRTRDRRGRRQRSVLGD